MTKYIVKIPYMPSLGLHSYYTVNTKEEAEHIAKQCIKAEIIEGGAEDE
ncbi:hypothetical protein [Lactococcus garvieae]|uniref:Uncharacterized protein n=1 Tax=Lactococcus garvieae TaxID=1363 RepID=A0A1I4I7D0_9LACT|nr:hypothetical protein [Lactococcus garvieae]SFL49596.1 hypothetical protein SAMN05216438_11325 [Lactococcus garvieae]